MRVILSQATLTPVFQAVDETGRAVRTFGPPGGPWVLHHCDLEGLQERVERFEREATAELARERDGDSSGESRAPAATPASTGANGRSAARRHAPVE